MNPGFKIRNPNSAIRNAIAVLFAFLFVGLPLFGAGERTVFVFYYAWYANPVYDGDWRHWQENNHQPPSDLASAYYPRLGPYSSSDPYVIDRHMRWISSAGINVLIYSWWGRQDATEKLAGTVLDNAAGYGLKLSFLLEPYPGRNAAGMCDDIEYLDRVYGNHPAFFRIARKTSSSDNPRDRGVFFIYQPDQPVHELQQMSDQIHNGRADSILLLQSTDVALAEDSHADGLFAYEAYQNVKDFYKGITETAHRKNLIFLPCVSPGFNMNRTNRFKSGLFRGRRFGLTYDDWWRTTLAAEPESVTIISFNEWHEGTQIEPAVLPAPNPGYYSYRGSWRRFGNSAVRSYLDRTAHWIRIFQGRT